MYRYGASSIEGCASEMLAKVQEKIPYVKQNPSEIIEAAKSSAKEVASYYLEKVQGSTVAQTAVKQLENAVSFTDLIVELCFPTDGSNLDDMKELEQIEEDEGKGVMVHAMNVKTKAYRRGTRKLMEYKKVQTAVDMVSSMVQYAQSRLSETTGKIIKGSSHIASDLDKQVQNFSGEPSQIQEESNEKRNLIAESWDSIYKTSMFIPKKALEVTGEVYVSAKEMVFAYSNANTIKEMPTSVVKMAELYYHNVQRYNIVNDVKDKAVAFVYVPAQVISDYIQSNRVVQWIIPSDIKTESIQVMETINDEPSKCEIASNGSVITASSDTPNGNCEASEIENNESTVTVTVNDQSEVTVTLNDQPEVVETYEFRT